MEESSEPRVRVPTLRIPTAEYEEVLPDDEESSTDAWAEPRRSTCVYHQIIRFQSLNKAFNDRQTSTNMPGRALFLKFNPSHFVTSQQSDDTWDRTKYAVQPSKADGRRVTVVTKPSGSQYEEVLIDQQRNAEYDSVIRTARLETDMPDPSSLQVYHPASVHDYEEIPYGVGGQRKIAATRSTKWRWVLLATAILAIAGIVAGIGASGAFSSSHSSSAPASCAFR